MNETKQKSVIVLAFADDQDKHLAMIGGDEINIFSTLLQHHEQGRILV
ncbi:hypothetical protein JW998_11340 [candidate division KSB1 bacterium]|nr:hypothetical protein [candidate division KSB1 bacterium]